MLIPAFLCAVLASAPADAHAFTAGFAQQDPPTNPPAVLFEHDGVGVDGFVLHLTPQQSPKRPIRILTPKTEAITARPHEYRILLPVLRPGVYGVEVGAYNKHGEGPRTAGQPPFLRVQRGDRAYVPPPEEADGPTDTAVAPPPPPAPPPPTLPNRSGIFKRLWRIVVGDDTPQ
jgi:hypothetical protein